MVEMGLNRFSAGILLYRLRGGGIEVFLVHPGGPFWAKKDDGAWSIPKGEYESADDPLTAAKREFHEETGFEVGGTFHPLIQSRQPSGKVISAWAVEGEVDAAAVKSNTFALEWPPKSGKIGEFPEIDRGGWFDLQVAQVKLHPGQRGFLNQLRQLLQGHV
ncbi:MAG: Phosphohydrolase [Nitrospira sp.]|jgi:predicted NUDIX family NTP pyrophosphohydrolase|nr:Phosphohydrolase [Nitrospira sp.]